MTKLLSPSSFKTATEEFTKGLRRGEIEGFRTTSLEDVKRQIMCVQAKQHAERRLQDCNRLQPFLTAIEQYAEVVGSFDRNIKIVGFIWGPLKTLLQETSVFDEAFCELLNAYERLGESLPLLLLYQELFHTKPHMVRVLVLLYEDILKFQHSILRFFQQPQWQEVFEESWDTCKSRFSSIVSSIAKRRSLVESQASPSQIDEVQESIQKDRQIDDNQIARRNLQQGRDVINWLNPTDSETDQTTSASARAEYPGTGQWLLDNKMFKEWFDPRFPTIPPLLWLSGIPGAGKTILASLVVEKARELNPKPTVLFFFFKNGDAGRDNFGALGRSLLAQFLKYDDGLLPSLYKEFRLSVETVLSSASVEKLLYLAFENCKSAYIILDGLDECLREQRKYIAQWFRSLVENLSNNEPERLRCLFVSQDDGPARKDFAGLASIKIRPEDNQHDIKHYGHVEAGKLLQESSGLTEEKVGWIADKVADTAQGQFLLAKLIWANLSEHTSISRLEEELNPNVFPKGINDAYRRIMVRITEQIPQAAKEDILRLLGWLVCAKRSLKWHEIQGMNSINLDERRVAFEHQSFIKSPKDLLGSLVEIRADDTIELVHLTAKFFLLEDKHIIPSKEELRLANLCIDYLNLPAFMNPPTKEGVLNGDYGLMDYAVQYWLPHLEAGTKLRTDEDEELMSDLAESLQLFIDQHWTSPTRMFTLAKSHSDKLQPFRAYPFYDELEQAVASTRKQLKHFGNMKKEEIALNLNEIVIEVRKVLESVVSNTTDGSAHHKAITTRYGKNLFKCPRLSCHFFTMGFPSAADRNKHISKHERPFRCRHETCVGYTFGFASTIELERHMRENHLAAAIHEEEFPTDQDVHRSIMLNQMAETTSASADLLDPHESTEEAPGAPTNHNESESESDVEPRQVKRKRTRQTEFECPHCSKKYKKRYNLKSHLLTHVVDRFHVCPLCQKKFARLSDYERHKGTHIDSRNHVCEGCGKSFARADTLRKHFESRKGQLCCQPLEQEQEQQHEEEQEQEQEQEQDQEQGQVQGPE